MPDFGFERSLLLCLLLTTAVFASAWFFANRRLTASRSQARLDALLIGYAVQYVSVGLTGLLGCLDLRCVSGIAVFLAVALVAGGWKARTAKSLERSPCDEILLVGVFLFVVGFVMAFAHSQADLPVISNDAMTYHFPAAVQWMQQRRIGLFQTWFFNPANTYSPLAGSIFITWLMLPFGNDLLARFVEVPALLCVGMAMHRLCREMGIRPAVAGLVTAAALLCRPLFLPCLMGKDDLFVAFFFIATLVALSPDRAQERFGGVRIGIAIGLLLATKYTALLAIPMLLPAIRWRNSPTEPDRAGPVTFRGSTPRLRRICIATTFAILLAGPWYLRNLIATGNPLFPQAIPHLFRGLFTTAASSAFHARNGAIATLIGGQYGLPIFMAMVLAFAAVACAAVSPSIVKISLLRTCVLGPLIGLVLFFWRSPFPEVRFLLPMFLLLFALGGYAIDRMFADERFAIAAAMMLACLSLFTLFDIRRQTAGFAAIALVAAMVGIASYLWAKGRRLRWMVLFTTTGFAFGIITYINWSAYCRGYLATKSDVYASVYPDLNPLWTWVNTNLPDDARVAYTNLYYVYPLQGNALHRQLVYAPTRRGLQTIADLPWLGNHLPGEQIVPAAASATVASPDRAVWLANLQKLRCKYLVIGRFTHGGVVPDPPEAAFAEKEPRFQRVFHGAAGDIYLIRSSEEVDDDGHTRH